MYKRILSFLTILSILLLIGCPAYADYTSSNYKTVDIWYANMNAASHGSWIGSTISSFMSSALGDGSVCALSSDGLHHSSNYDPMLGSDSDARGYYTYFLCDYCGSMFKCYSDDFSAAYDASVSEMPATGYSSTGGIYWYPTWEDCEQAKLVVYSSETISSTTYHYYEIVSNGNFTGSYTYGDCVFSAGGRTATILYDSASYCSNYLGNFFAYFKAPVSGYYKLVSSIFASGTKSSGSSFIPVSVLWAADTKSTYRTAGSSFYQSSPSRNFSSCNYISVTLTLPVFQIIPAASTTNNYYVNASRPTYNITYNLATVTNSGSYTVINNVYENQTVINETTNIFTNPSTGEEYEIDGWEYDYKTRKYTCNLVDGSLLEVTFGDANVTVNLNGELEYYYYASKDTEGGGVTGGDTDCDHDFALAEAVEATCTTGGYKVYVCKSCGASYKDTSFAIGHDYQLVETVDPTVTLDESTLVCPGCNANEGLTYELTGEQTFTVTCPECSESWSVAGTLVAGYDLYRCANCGDEYHDSTGEGITRDDAGYWAWLQAWLQNFKTWLGEKLDALKSSSGSGGGDGKDVSLDLGDSEKDKTVKNFFTGFTTFIGLDDSENTDIDYNITYTDDEGEQQETSLKKLISKFAFVKDIWKIGRTMISVVSEDAAYAYEFDPTIGNEATGTDEGEDDAPALDGDADTFLSSGSSGAPSFPINLSAANSVYGWNYGGEVEMLDLSWYTPYKETVDKLVGGFLWLFFMWKLFMKAPGIISGASMDSSKAEDIKSGTKGKRR